MIIPDSSFEELYDIQMDITAEWEAKFKIAEKEIAELKASRERLLDKTLEQHLYDVIDKQQSDIKELAENLKGAADDIVDCANYYNNDSTVVVTEAHDEADKYRALANKHLKGE